MATQYGTTGNDILVVTAGNTYRGLDGDDIYMVSSALVPNGANVVFSDTVGNNKVQFIDGLTIASSVFYADEVTLTLSNGATINIVGADKFGFYQGGNAITGDLPTVQTFAEFAADLGVPTLPTGTGTANGAGDYEVGEPPVPPTPTFSLQGSATVAEGGNATYTVTLSSAPAADVTVNYATAYASGASAADITGTGAGTLTFTAANWNTPQTITIPVVQDTNVESGEKIAVSLLGNSAGTAIDDTKKLVSTSLTEVPVAFTFTGSAEVYEAQTATYTVVANRPVDADTTVSFSVVAGDNLGADQGTGNTNLNDFAGGAFNPFAVKILKGETTATYTVAASDDAKTELPETFLVKAAITGQTLDNVSTTLLDGLGATAGQTFTLTTGVDSIPGLVGSAGSTGTDGDDTIVATNTTLTALDSINGGLGKNTLKYSDVAGATALPGGLTVSNVQTLQLASAGDFGGAGGLNFSTWTGVTSITTSTSAKAVLTAATTADLSVSGATDVVTLDGGKDVTVNVGTTGKAITVGATTVNAGKITVTDTVVGAADIKVDGGTDVTITATGSSGGANTLEVGTGGAATDLPSGTVTVSSAHTGVAATDVALSAVTVKGGTTVTVTQTADTSKAAADTTGATLTQGAVTVTGGGKTTSVTVNQAKSVAETVAVTAVAGVTETASVKFGTMKAGDILIFGTTAANDTLDAGELRFTASVDMTAAEVAAAFGNIVNGTIPVAGDTQGGATGAAAASKGVFSTNTTGFTGWTSGAASGDTVVFTSTTANSNATDLVLDPAAGNTGTASVLTKTEGSAATAAVTGVLGVIGGAVTVNDAATASITTVSLDGYGGATTNVGNTAALSKLTTLTLANSGGATAGATNGAVDVYLGGATSLNLSVNNVKGAVNLDKTSASVVTLNLTSTGANSSFALTAAGAKNLTIAGDKVATLSAGTFTALETVTITGSAGAVFDTDEADTLTAFNTSGTTGAVTAFIDGTKATYTGGAGADTVNLATGTALTKAIDLGAGNDTLVFVAAVTGSTAAVNGGDGTDTLSMGTARADALDAATQNFYTNFERLLINDSTGSATVDLAPLGFANYVTTSGSTGTLTLNNLANNGTVVMTAAHATGTTIAVKDAATGTADVLNVTGQVTTAGIDFGTVTAANVETVNLTATDALLDDNADGVNDAVSTVTAILTADKATAVNLGTSNANLALTMTGSSKVTSIDGSGMTGALTVTSVNTTAATTVKGGSGNDVLTANATLTSAADVLTGGAGNDILVSNAGLNTLTGGDGNDVFRITTASLNVNSYATVTDFVAGDLLQMTGADKFANAKVTLGNTAVFQDYANAAINALTTANDAGWFQYGGDTYVVVDKGNTTAFVNGTDVIVKLTGLIDLTNASFNDVTATIAL